MSEIEGNVVEDNDATSEEQEAPGEPLKGLPIEEGDTPEDVLARAKNRGEEIGHWKPPAEDQLVRPGQSDPDEPSVTPPEPERAI